MSENMGGHEMRQRMTWGAGIAIGMGAGVAIGAALDNMAVGVGVGIAIGLLFALVVGRPRRRNDAAHDGDPDEGNGGED